MNSAPPFRDLSLPPAPKPKRAVIGPLGCYVILPGEDFQVAANLWKEFPQTFVWTSPSEQTGRRTRCNVFNESNLFNIYCPTRNAVFASPLSTKTGRTWRKRKDWSSQLRSRPTIVKPLLFWCNCRLTQTCQQKHLKCLGKYRTLALLDSRFCIKLTQNYNNQP